MLSRHVWSLPYSGSCAGTAAMMIAQGASELEIMLLNEAVTSVEDVLINSASSKLSTLGLLLEHADVILINDITTDIHELAYHSHVVLVYKSHVYMSCRHWDEDDE